MNNMWFFIGHRKTNNGGLVKPASKLLQTRRQEEKREVEAKTIFEDLCDEDKILVFYKKLLNEWNQELDKMSPEAKNQTVVATFMQCARDLNPLFDLCRKRLLNYDIRKALVVMVECCMNREYIAAMDQYLNKIAIGNAPWPIGVTMVGIHERSAREKIHTNSVAHVMNDETTRKLLYSVKRLVTFCQRRHPNVWSSIALRMAVTCNFCVHKSQLLKPQKKGLR
uniref:Prp18 domain-containing protein n=1 Tax=Solanum lycopersicum TaxID=4081 RepID=K4CFA6_SOLLC